MRRLLVGESGNRCSSAAPSPRPGADRGTVVKFALFYTSGTAPAAPQAGQHRDYRVDLLGGPAMMVEGPPGARLRARACRASR